MIARGSLTELLSYFAVAHELKYIQQADLDGIEMEMGDVAKMLNRLISSLREKRFVPHPSDPESRTPNP